MELFPYNLQQSRKGRPAEKKLDYLFASLGQSVREKNCKGGGGVADLTSLWIPIRRKKINKTLYKKQLSRI